MRIDVPRKGLFCEPIVCVFLAARFHNSPTTGVVTPTVCPEHSASLVPIWPLRKFINSSNRRYKAL
uniref:Uncharacterized protein n=1 Tax=Lepeophtheirus salmonis TaxID=72036 RepID=A0A0K2UMW6_LEPSM